MAFRVTVNGLGGCMCEELKADRPWLVKDVKHEVESQYNIPMREQRILCGGCGTELPDFRPVVPLAHMASDENLELAQIPCHCTRQTHSKNRNPLTQVSQQEVTGGLVVLTLLRRSPEQAAWLEQLQLPPDGSNVWKKVPLHLKSDPDIVRAALERYTRKAAFPGAIRESKRALQVVNHPDVRSRSECVAVASRIDPCALQFASEQLRSDSCFVCSLLEESTAPELVLRYASPKLLADPTFMLLALKACPEALAIASSAFVAAHKLMSTFSLQASRCTVETWAEACYV